MCKVLSLKESVQYCSKNIFATSNIHTVKYGTETLAHLGPKVWAIVPTEETNSLEEFKNKIKNGNPTNAHVNFVEHILAALDTLIRGVGVSLII